MNQAIIFSDNEQYNANLQQIEFQAQCQGALITCIISSKDLCKMNPDQAHLVDDKEALLALFEGSRFDIEDIAEHMINQQDFRQDGKIYLQGI